MVHRMNDQDLAARRRRHKGRGAVTNPHPRYAEQRREAVDDGWYQEAPDSPPTELAVDTSRTIISHNRSPDIPFDRSINPYRGCEHGCIYCYARPTHAWLGLSPGLDFERKLFYKPDAAAQLERELARPGYRPATIVLGAITDPYQPIERKLLISRQILEVLQACRHPVAVTTKSALVLRDLDLLGPMAAERCAAVQLSIATLDAELARRLEPRAATPQRRLETIRALTQAGISTGVLVSPLIPGLTDQDLERVLEAAAQAGASRVDGLLLRLPLELEDLFADWLRTHFPARADKVLSLIRQCRAGQLNDARFGTRFTGTGPIAALLQQRLELAAGRLGLTRQGMAWALDTEHFRLPGPASAQGSLFDPPAGG